MARLQRTNTRHSLAEVFAPLRGGGDFLLDVSVDVSSAALCLDTCIEPCAGGSTENLLEAGLAYELRAAQGCAGPATAAPRRAHRRAHAWR